MWSLGCIMGELLKKKTLFDGKSEIEQMHKIFGMLGAPNNDVWPGWSKLPAANKVCSLATDTLIRPADLLICQKELHWVDPATKSGII